MAYDNGDCLNGDVTLANSRLIAAAHELLEALQVVIAGYENRQDSDLFDMTVSGEDIKRAVSAIKKALGETK